MVLLKPNYCGCDGMVFAKRWHKNIVDEQEEKENQGQGKLNAAGGNDLHMYMLAFKTDEDTFQKAAYIYPNASEINIPNAKRFLAHLWTLRDNCE